MGLYGVDGAATPNLDRLATNAIVLDRLFLDSLEPQEHLRSLWTASHFLNRRSPVAKASTIAAASIWNRCSEFASQAHFFTDCPGAADLAEKMGCENVILLESAEQSDAAEDSLDCCLLAPFAVASQAIAEQQVQGLVWIHTRGLRLPWDAPLELRQQFCDPDDPDPPSETQLPELAVTAETDPDIVVGWGQVAAAQVAVLDEAVGLVTDAVQTQQTIWNQVFLGLGGAPVGEHGHIGWDGCGLHETHLACAAIINPSDKLPIGQRRSEICQLPDLGATILGLLGNSDGTLPEKETTTCDTWGRDLLKVLGGIDLRKPSVPLDQAVVVHSRHGSGANATQVDVTEDSEQLEFDICWVRTAAWTARFTKSSPLHTTGAVAGPTESLFVMPDDRWETCDVASRRIYVVDLLHDLSTQFLEAAKLADRQQTGRPDEDLTNLMR